jgi:hypothetical protein
MGDQELIEVAGKVVGYAATLVSAFTPLIVAHWTLKARTSPSGSLPGGSPGELRADVAREVEAREADHARHVGAEALPRGRPKRRRSVIKRDRDKGRTSHN